MINQILKDIDDEECYYVGTNGCLYQDLEKNELLAIKEEIERLEKCYCNRSDCAGRLNQKNEVYDSVVQRNEKAIEYIEKHNDYFLLKREVKELLSILKGVDKE